MFRLPYGGKVMSKMSGRPNFFIVGAPKCGTTSLYEYLRQHPEIFMPHSENRYWMYKEPYFFCEELIDWPGLRVHSEEAYLNLFKDAGDAPRCGEATALNLFSHYAASRIKVFAPDAKIIIMLRNPVDMMKAWHHDCLRWGHEDVVDFQKAVELESMRKQGKMVPAGSGYSKCLAYTDIASYAPQVERFFEVFSHHAVKVVLLDDMASDPLGTFQKVTEFLGVDSSFVPDFERHNPRAAVSKSELVHVRLKGLFRKYASWAQPMKRVVPSGVIQIYNYVLRQLDGSIEDRPVDQAFLSELADRMAPGIDELSRLLGRDLYHWKMTCAEQQFASIELS